MTFFFTFRSKVEDMGGPKAISRDFMVHKNVVLRELGDCVVEAGNWEVTKYGRGVYMNAVKYGKILWTELTMMPWEEENDTTDCDGKDCIPSLHTFVKK